MHIKTRWSDCEIYLTQGDITRLEVDAIVNAANAELRGGGGVDGAIHRRGGSSIMTECRRIMALRSRPLAPGEVEVTAGGDLPARHVIHAVGPIYYQHSPQEAARLLGDCYRASLRALAKFSGSSIAFPSISTGAYCFPADEACEVVLKAVEAELLAGTAAKKVVFCTFDPDDFELYEQAFTRRADRNAG